MVKTKSQIVLGLFPACGKIKGRKMVGRAFFQGRSTSRPFSHRFHVTLPSILSASLFVSLSGCVSDFPTACLSACVSSVSLHVCFCLSDCLSVALSIYLSIGCTCLSFCHYLYLYVNLNGWFSACLLSFYLTFYFPKDLSVFFD